MPDPLKDLATSNDEVNAKKKVKEQEYTIKALEKEIASLKEQITLYSEHPGAVLSTIESQDPYIQSVWHVTAESLLRQTFSVPGSININNPNGIKSSIERILKVADMAVDVARHHQKDKELEDRALAAAKANVALSPLLQSTELP
jgi:hypothetical protein